MRRRTSDRQLCRVSCRVCVFVRRAETSARSEDKPQGSMDIYSYLVVGRSGLESLLCLCGPGYQRETSRESSHISVSADCALERGTAGATQAGTATMTKGLYNLLVTKCTILNARTNGCASHLYGGAAPSTITQVGSHCPRHFSAVLEAACDQGRTGAHAHHYTGPPQAWRRSECASPIALRPWSTVMPRVAR